MSLSREVGAAAAAICLVGPVSVAAQTVDGYVSLMADVLPDVQLKTGERRALTELRARVFIERQFVIADRIRLMTSGFAEGLLADRGQSSATTAGIVRPQEFHLEATWQKADLRVGFTRVVWGRLDEFQPTDVVNPLDLTRFFLEGRAEGRMPVGVVRGRYLPTDRFTIEAIYVPVFRRGRFDQLDEDTSPFNAAPVPLRSERPPRSLTSGQGGVRTSVTTGRIDWAASVYRGFETLPVYELIPAAGSGSPTWIERFARFTMVGGDFETVRGEWGLRGEVAARSNHVEGGVGVDRRTGAYRVAGTILATRRLSDQEPDDSGVSMIAAVDRSFARESRNVRLLGVYNPGDQSAFARMIASFNLRDDVSMEMSGGWFTGSGNDALSQLATRDFLYARLKVFF